MKTGQHKTGQRNMDRQDVGTCSDSEYAGQKTGVLRYSAFADVYKSSCHTADTKAKALAMSKIKEKTKTQTRHRLEGKDKNKTKTKTETELNSFKTECIYIQIQVQRHI